MSDEIVISPRLKIPAAELRFRTSRSGGPGGQHVNTSDTQVELLFDLEASPSLGPRQRARLREKLASRTDGRGVLHLRCGSRRSQAANRREVVERFVELLREALRRPRPRKATAPTRAARRRRREAKEKRSKLKQQRRKPRSTED